MMTPIEEARSTLVRRWGEMSGYWGISRTMAEIHALLFVSTEPLCTDDIMEKLHISRGNTSMNLRALVDWGLIERVHKLGQRREYFQADTDVWRMFETIMRERRRREVEPIVATIDHCRELVQSADTKNTDAEERKTVEERLQALQEFLEAMGKLFEIVLHFGSAEVEKFARMLARAQTDPLPGGEDGNEEGEGTSNGVTRVKNVRKRPARKVKT